MADASDFDPATGWTMWPAVIIWAVLTAIGVTIAVLLHAPAAWIALGIIFSPILVPLAIGIPIEIVSSVQEALHG
jgi:hypothetical protein